MIKQQDILWRPSEAVLPDDLSPAAWRWLCAGESVTHWLRERFAADIQFHLLDADWGSLSIEERAALNLSDSVKPWVRRIEWRYQHDLWISARVIIPGDCATMAGRQLLALRASSIGDVLFKKDGFVRTYVQFAQLPASHPYCQQAADQLGLADGIWARRSFFCCADDNIMVNEVFLPQFFSSNFT